MKLVIAVALALVAVASAVPVEPDVQILRNELVQQPDGSYTLVVETSDGTKREEVGELKTILDEENVPHTVVVMRGQYVYVNNDGTPEKIEYFSDETGYHANGASVPQAPSRR